jgi:putative cardiolipin synthase
MKLLILLALLLSLPTFAQEEILDDQDGLEDEVQGYSSLIPYPYYAEDKENINRMMIIESGSMALQARIDMIRRAQKSIDVEYFIYNTDMAGKIISRELVEAAKRGVKVRILVDHSLPIFKLNEYYADALARFGIEVKYYNTAPLIRISTVQFRNHRKILLIDDTEVITGGRNIGDDYFNLSTKFNFNDRDLHVTGPIVKVVKDSFDAFFKKKISKTPAKPYFAELVGESETERNARWKVYNTNLEKAARFLQETPEEIAVREKTKAISHAVMLNKRWHDCHHTTYSTDAPGANFFSRLNPNYDMKYRFLRKTLYDKISVIDKSILISSPYMLHNRHSKNLLKELRKKNVDVTIYTNSLASTDAIYVAANLYLDLFRWRRQGINIFLHDGNWSGVEEGLDEDIKKSKWGTHDKTQIYETSTYSELMVGTYNIDNRSSFYNTEMAMFCRGNDELVDEARHYILKQKTQGITINEDGTATDREGEKKSIYGTSRRGVLVMKLITLPSWLLKFLL